MTPSLLLQNKSKEAATKRLAAWWANFMGGATLALALSTVTAPAFGQTQPSGQSNAPYTGYTNDGTLFMAGQMVGNPHQILHDVQNQALFDVQATRFTNTTDAAFGQGTLAQMETHMTQLLPTQGNELFTRMYVSPVNPYPQTPIGAFNNYVTYNEVIANSQQASYQLTVANDNNLWAFKTLAAPNNQAMNILIKELPAHQNFIANSDPMGGAVGVKVNSNGDAAALQNYFATTMPYDFSWQAAMGPWAAGGQRPNNLAKIAGFGTNTTSGEAEATFYNWTMPRIDVFQDPQGFSFGAAPRAYITDDGVNGVSFSQEGNYTLLALGGGSAAAYGFSGPDAQRRYEELMRQWATNYNPFYATSHDGDPTQFDLNRYLTQFGEYYQRTMMCEVHNVCRSDWIEFRDDFLKPVVAVGVAIWAGPAAAELVGDALMMSIPATGAAMSPAAVGFISVGAGGFAAGAASTYVMTGDLNQSLRGGLRGAFTGAALYSVGSWTTTTGEATQSMTGQINPATGQPYIVDVVNPFINTLGHAAVGCASNVIFGDNGTSAGSRCGQGAAGAGVGAASGHLFNSVGANDSAGQLVASTISGGLGSVAAGGSFADGAFSGALGFLFNCRAHGGCIGGNYDPTDPNYHFYEPFSSPVLCNSAEPGCLEAVREQLSCASAPGQNGCTEVGKEREYSLAGGQPITQYRPNPNMIINGTSPGHVLEDGFVVRWIAPDSNGDLRIWTSGVGVNSSRFWSFINQYGGYALFQGVSIRNVHGVNHNLLCRRTTLC